MANSSQCVIQALQDTKNAILAERPSSIPKQPLIKANEDVHLQALQVLAAHVKLLLDVPEHLWKMLEKRKYFTAAWLYLLSRVVHRALVQDDLDDEIWQAQGIDVLESFPLVQRQWEVVAQFRSQIIHKAVLSLRDIAASSEEICATLLTLHLLDSRPLPDTLTALLDQRYKSLQILFSKTPSPRGSIREIKKCILLALEFISHTMKSSRDVFEATASQLSLIRKALEFIQTDSAPSGLPSELQLTTQTLLGSLPSSSTFSALPQNLTSYKPHMDINSHFSSLSAAHLDQKVYEWFQRSTDALQISCKTWLLDANNVKVIWSIRSSVRDLLQASATLKLSESDRLKSLFDEVCRERIVTIWQTGLSDAEVAFRDQLTTTVKSVNSSSEVSADASPMAHLFDSPPLPTVSQLEEMPLQKYRTSLQRQLVGRVSLLDNVLRTLEKCAAALQEDLLQVLHGDDSDTFSLITRLKESYQPHAQNLCTAVLNDIEASVNALPDKTESDIHALVFVGRLAEELYSSSSFISNISCDEVVSLDFRQKAKSLYDTIIDRWREFTVLHVLSGHRIAAPLSGLKPLPCVSPSNDLIQSLLSLAEAIQSLGFSRDSSRHIHLADQTLRLFVRRLLDRNWEHNVAQALHDVAFLRKLAEIWGPHWSDVRELLDSRTRHIRQSHNPYFRLISFQNSVVSDLPTDETLSSRSADYIAKTQTILAAVLPYPAKNIPVQSSGKSMSSDKFAALLLRGVPSSEQQYRPAVEVAKPSSRFGLLLIN
ncbi:hypothetical protein BDP27DRAFT_1286851 [Rhodocollybia butyracea]|uniref:Conserved oligomeric Golgi complex subunit 1 n=1 Tax=Rhodocollybia butyracea TaxID=206335 RepID=A0A9P5UD51_9AGAR|nr:hypothetical protein BDP27DRAFT_1286851 [Rhodocollybia butyracea]